MIKLDIVRYQNKIMPKLLTKTESNLQKQILGGLNSLPARETQLISVKIFDRPIARFLANLLEIGEEIVPIKMKTTFMRVQTDNEFGAIRKDFKDVVSLQEVKDLKKGKNLVLKEGSFLNKLVKNINDAITE